MSSLEKYIEEVKENTENFSDIEKLRYVYLDLGKRFSFNLDFSFGNSETKKKIYNKSHKSNELEQSMENNTIICKTSSTIYEYIMKKLGVNIKTETDDMDMRKYPHTYNVVTTKENKKYNLKNDIIFKAFFSRKGNEIFLIDFLEALLNIKIESIKIKEEVNIEQLSVDEKGGRLDLQAKLNDGIIVNIELQMKI